jgi:hypothetical protein
VFQQADVSAPPARGAVKAGRSQSKDRKFRENFANGWRYTIVEPEETCAAGGLDQRYCMRFFNGTGWNITPRRVGIGGLDAERFKDIAILTDRLLWLGSASHRRWPRIVQGDQTGVSIEGPHRKKNH